MSRNLACWIIFQILVCGCSRNSTSEHSEVQKNVQQSTLDDPEPDFMRSPEVRKAMSQP